MSKPVAVQIHITPANNRMRVADDAYRPAIERKYTNRRSVEATLEDYALARELASYEL